MNEKSEMQSEAEIKSRSCANCACHEVKTLAPGAVSQSFCRRDTPMAARMRFQEQMFGPDKMPLFLKDGKTLRMQEVERDVYLHKPTEPSLVCFDGWRALGTLPGEDTASNERKTMVAGYQRLLADLERDRKEFGLPLDPQDETH